MVTTRRSKARAEESHAIPDSAKGATTGNTIPLSPRKTRSGRARLTEAPVAAPSKTKEIIPAKNESKTTATKRRGRPPKRKASKAVDEVEGSQEGKEKSESGNTTAGRLISSVPEGKFALKPVKSVPPSKRLKKSPIKQGSAAPELPADTSPEIEKLLVASECPESPEVEQCEVQGQKFVSKLSDLVPNSHTDTAPVSLTDSSDESPSKDVISSVVSQLWTKFINSSPPASNISANDGLPSIHGSTDDNRESSSDEAGEQAAPTSYKNSSVLDDSTTCLSSVKDPGTIAAEDHDENSDAPVIPDHAAEQDLHELDLVSPSHLTTSEQILVELPGHSHLSTSATTDSKVKHQQGEVILDSPEKYIPELPMQSPSAVKPTSSVRLASPKTGTSVFMIEMANVSETSLLNLPPTEIQSDTDDLTRSENEQALTSQLLLCSPLPQQFSQCLSTPAIPTTTWIDGFEVPLPPNDWSPSPERRASLLMPAAHGYVDTSTHSESASQFDNDDVARAPSGDQHQHSVQDEDDSIMQISGHVELDLEAIEHSAGEACPQEDSSSGSSSRDKYDIQTVRIQNENDRSLLTFHESDVMNHGLITACHTVSNQFVPELEDDSLVEALEYELALPMDNTQNGSCIVPPTMDADVLRTESLARLSEAEVLPLSPHQVHFEDEIPSCNIQAPAPDRANTPLKPDTPQTTIGTGISAATTALEKNVRQEITTGSSAQKSVQTEKLDEYDLLPKAQAEEHDMIPALNASQSDETAHLEFVPLNSDEELSFVQILQKSRDSDHSELSNECANSSEDSAAVPDLAPISRASFGKGVTYQSDFTFIDGDLTSQVLQSQHLEFQSGARSLSPAANKLEKMDLIVAQDHVSRERQGDNGRRHSRRQSYMSATKTAIRERELALQIRQDTQEAADLQLAAETEAPDVLLQDMPGSVERKRSKRRSSSVSRKSSLSRQGTCQTRSRGSMNDNMVMSPVELVERSSPDTRKITDVVKVQALYRGRRCRKQLKDSFLVAHTLRGSHAPGAAQCPEVDQAKIRELSQVDASHPSSAQSDILSDFVSRWQSKKSLLAQEHDGSTDMIKYCDPSTPRKQSASVPGAHESEQASLTALSIRRNVSRTTTTGSRLPSISSKSNRIIPTLTKLDPKQSELMPFALKQCPTTRTSEFGLDDTSSQDNESLASDRKRKVADTSGDDLLRKRARMDVKTSIPVHTGASSHFPTRSKSSLAALQTKSSTPMTPKRLSHLTPAEVTKTTRAFTMQNRIYRCDFDRVVVRKEVSRPPSPTAKIQAKMATNARTKRRRLMKEKGYAFGAGDEETYTPSIVTPERKAVKWGEQLEIDLVTLPKTSPSKYKDDSEVVPCLAPTRLRTFGNIQDNIPLTPILGKAQKVLITKYLYKGEQDEP